MASEMMKLSYRGVSTLLQGLCTLALGALPLYWVSLGLRPEVWQKVLTRALPFDVQWQTVQAWQWQSVWALSWGGVLLVCACLYTLKPVLKQFGNRQFFNGDNSLALRRLSRLLCLQALVHPLLVSGASLLLSWNHPPGQRLLSVSFSSQTFQLMLMSGLMLMVSELLVEGCGLAEENQQFV